MSAAEFKYDDVVLKSGSHEQTAKRLELFVANLEKLEQQIAVVQKKVHVSALPACPFLDIVVHCAH